MSNSNTTQESLEIMKESEKKVVEESVNKTKYVSRSPSKEEVEKDGGEEVSMRQESQVSGQTGGRSLPPARGAGPFPPAWQTRASCSPFGTGPSPRCRLPGGCPAGRAVVFPGCSLSLSLNLFCSEWNN